MTRMILWYGPDNPEGGFLDANDMHRIGRYGDAM